MYNTLSNKLNKSKEKCSPFPFSAKTVLFTVVYYCWWPKAKQTADKLED